MQHLLCTLYATLAHRPTTSTERAGPADIVPGNGKGRKINPKLKGVTHKLIIYYAKLV